MEDNRLTGRLKRWILHPFLFGLYPVIALLAINVKQIGPLYAIRPSLLALILSIVLLLLFRPVLKDWRRAAIVVTFVLLLFFLYGHVITLVRTIEGIGIVGKNRYFGITWAFLFVASLWFITKKIVFLDVWTRVLNLIGLILLGFSLIQIVAYQLRTFLSQRRQQVAESRSIFPMLHPEVGKKLPDIYYIIPDTYTRGDALQEAFGYDNSIFLSGLEQRGFFVASCSQSNYPSTELSLTSSLNMDYLSELDPGFGSSNVAGSDLVVYLHNNAVRQTLEDFGYRYIAFESGYPPTEFRDADTYLSPQTDIQNMQFLGGLTAFESILFRTTALNFFYETRFFPGEWKNTLFDNAYLLHRNRILYALDVLPDVATIPEPKFVFVHILAPHNPFVFGPNGEVLQRRTPFTLNADGDAATPEDYISGFNDQISYLNDRILGIVDEILANAANPVIILIQGDHGSPRTPEWNTAILNAYYFPAGDGRDLYPSISPVNSFRVVFNAYFGGDLEILEDRVCDSSNDNPFDCRLNADPNPMCITP